MTDPIEMTDDANQDALKRFEQRQSEIFDSLGGTLEKENVAIAFAVVIDPKSEQPLIYYRGHLYDVMSTVIKIVGKLRNDLVEDIS